MLSERVEFSIHKLCKNKRGKNKDSNAEQRQTNLPPYFWQVLETVFFWVNWDLQMWEIIIDQNQHEPDTEFGYAT